MECGIQVSSFRPILKTAAQVDEAFRQIRLMGCQTVQLQWIDPAVSIDEIAQALEKHALRSVSVQEIYEDFMKDPAYYIRLNRKTGGAWLCLSRIPRDRLTPGGLEQMIGELRALSAQLKDEGMRLCFHPIRSDYQPVNGVPAYEQLLQALPDMALCLDLRHSRLTGHDLPELIRRHGDRLCMVHFKDGVLRPDGTDDLCPLGKGDTNWQGTVQACLDVDVPYCFAEQERWLGDPFEALHKSLNWLRMEAAACLPHA